MADPLALARAKEKKGESRREWNAFETKASYFTIKIALFQILRDSDQVWNFALRGIGGKGPKVYTLEGIRVIERYIQLATQRER